MILEIFKGLSYDWPTVAYHRDQSSALTMKQFAGNEALYQESLAPVLGSHDPECLAICESQWSESAIDVLGPQSSPTTLLCPLRDLHSFAVLRFSFIILMLSHIILLHYIL